MITVLGSNSNGNCYLIQAGGDSLLLECGVGILEIKKALNFNLRGLKGCLLTHHHRDHSKSAKDLVKMGINLYAAKETLKDLGIAGYRAKGIEAKQQFSIDNFKIIALEGFHMNNDGSKCTCLNYVIKHKYLGQILFITDSYYCPYNVPGCDYVMIECNHSVELLERNREQVSRVMQSHMNFETCKATLKKMEIEKTKEIILLHLSSRNAEEERFREEIENLTGKKVTVAKAGVEIE